MFLYRALAAQSNIIIRLLDDRAQFFCSSYFRSPDAVVARVLVHFVTMNLSRMSGPSMVTWFCIVVDEMVPILVLLRQQWNCCP